MHTANRKRKILAILMTLAMVLPFFSPMAVQAVEVEPTDSTLPTIHRIQGSNRFHTAIQVAQEGWSQSDTVLLARGDDYADALAAGPLAAKLDAPLLLTWRDRLHPGVVDEIHRLGVKEVLLIGGQAALSAEVEAALAALNVSTRRIAGSNRYETAVRIAEEFGPVDAAFLVSGNPDPGALAFADALSIAPVAGILERPILLSGKTRLPASVKSYLAEQASTLTTTYVIGGTAVLEEALEAELPGAHRISGSNRYRTNIAVLEHFHELFQSGTFYMATGTNFPDALSGGVLAAKYRAPLILVGASVILPTADYLKAHAVSGQTTRIFGGTSVISEPLEQRILAILQEAVAYRNALEKAEDAIAALPDPITLEDEAAVLEARAFSDAVLALDPGARIAGYELLLAAEALLASLKTDKAEVDAVVASIDALPGLEELELPHDAALKAARAAYEALKDSLKPQVGNLDVLEALEARMLEIHADHEAAQAVMALIQALPEAAAVTLAHGDAITAARAAYAALTIEQKPLVANLPRLVAAEDRLEELQAYKADAEAVDALIEVLPSLESLTLSHKDAVEAARTAYEALHAEAKDFVQHLALLEALETRLEAIQAAMAEAALVEALIDALPAVEALTLADEPDLLAARTAYEALSTEGKTHVGNLSKLEALEARILEIHADHEAAQAVMALIQALPEAAAVTLAHGDAISAARAAYVALTPDQKPLVENLPRLVAAEERLAVLLEKEANTTDVAAVKALLEGLIFVMDQADALLETDVEDAIWAQVDALDTRSVTITLKKESYEPAVAGDEADPQGTHGTYQFHMELQKGALDTLASDGTSSLTMTIQATAYVPPAAPQGTLVASSSHGDVVGVLYHRSSALYFKNYTVEAGWSQEVLVTEAAIAGRLQIDGDGMAHIVYAAENTVRYVTVSGTALSEPAVIESMGAGTLSRPDIAVDSGGFAHITYTDSRGSDTTYAAIMYAHNKEGAFQRALVYRGYYESWGSGTYDAKYYEKGSFITVDSEDVHHILTHEFAFFRTSGWIDRTYSVQLRSAGGQVSLLGQKIGSTSSSDVFDVYGFQSRNGLHHALYRNETVIGESFEETDGHVTSVKKRVTGFSQASGFDVTPEGMLIASVVSGGIQLFHEDALLETDPIPVAGTVASIHHLEGTFHLFHTDPSESTISVQEILLY